MILQLTHVRGFTFLSDYMLISLFQDGTAPFYYDGAKSQDMEFMSGSSNKFGELLITKGK